MATKAAVWGIDVGQCALKAIKLQPAGDKVEVLAYDTVDHDKILSHPECDADATIKAALEKFTSRNDIKGDLVAIAVPGQQTLSRFTKLPPVEQKRIPDIVKFEAGQQIPFDMDEVIWDYQTFSEPDSPDVEVGIFAIRKELIRKHLQFFTDTGIEPMLVQPSPLALYNAIRYDLAKMDKATILLDIGATATDLIVMEGSTIWSRPVPIGGNAFTEALVKSFKLSHSKAENLKRTAATTKYARQIFQAMRPVFADLISEIQRSIGFYTATHRESEIARILGVGNAFKLPGLQKFMQQNLQIEVDRFAAFNRVVPTAVSKNPNFEEAAPSMAVAFGLALQGLGVATITSSLLPPEIAKQIVWRKKRPFFGAAAACLLGTAGVIWFSNERAKAAVHEAGSGSAPPPVSAEDAQQKLLSASPSSPGQFAKTIDQCVQKLLSEYKKYENPPGAAANLKVIKDLSEFTPIVPRIVQAVHQGFGKQVVGIPGATTSDEYLARIEEAKRKKEELITSGGAASKAQEIAELDKIIDRWKRKEIWIQQFGMQYFEALNNSPDVQNLQLTQKEKDDLNGKPGWVLHIEGRTTCPEDDWVEKTVLKKSVLDEGRQDKRGFYFLTAMLINAGAVTSSADDMTSQQPGQNQFGGGFPGGGGRPGGRGAVFPGAGGRDVPQAPPTPPAPGQTSSGPGPKLWKPDPDQDPLTQEKVIDKDHGDHRFVAKVIAIKGDTPQALLATTQPAEQPAKTPAKTPAGKKDRR